MRSEEFINLANDRDLLSYAFKKLKLATPGDVTSRIFSSLEPGDLIEIFNSDGVQLYRSFSYFAFVQYSLVELSRHSFEELWDTESWVMREFNDVRRRIFSGKERGVVAPINRPYKQAERLTEQNAEYVFQRKLFSPVHSLKTGEVVAMIMVTRQGAVKRLFPDKAKIQKCSIKLAEAIGYGVAGNLATDLLKHIFGNEERRRAA